MNKFYFFIKGHIVAFIGFLSILSLTTNISAQTLDVQVGTQSGTSSNIPVNVYYAYTYSQQIYTAADLMTAGIIGSAQIQKIRVYKTSGSLTSATNWSVYLGNSSKTSFTSNTDWESASNLQQVFSGTVTDPGNNAWLEITFTNPFIWDGSSNLIVGIDENQSGFGSTTNFGTASLGSDRSIYYQNDYTNPDPATPPYATGRLGSVNIIQLVAVLPQDCTGAPVSSTISSNVGVNVCAGTDVTLSIQNAVTTYFANGIEYQWQYFDGTDWQNIVDGNESSLTINDISETTNYQVQIACTLSDQSTLLSPLSITVNQLPEVSVDITEGAFCGGSTVAINATGAETYTWTPTAGLNVANAASVNANPTTATVYTVKGTDANGCFSTAQSSISPYGQLTTTGFSNPVEFCEANVPVEITIQPGYEVIGGTWEYRFLDNTGTTELQGWNATNVYNFIPTEDSVYTLFAQMKNTACSSALDSVSINVVVGFGLEEIIVVDYDCNNLGGTADLINIFGQKEVSEIYNNNFNAPVDSPEFALFGNATYTENRLLLTPSAISQKGSAILTVPNFEPGDNNSFSLSFNLTADLPINTYGTMGADGMAYSFGDNLAHPSGSAHNGVGNKLRLSFDSASNGSENNNAPGVYLVYGWTATNAFGPTSVQVVAYSDNISSWKNKTDVPVNFEIDPSGKATLTVDGIVLINQVQLPAAYLNEDVSTWKHMFSAGTGGDAMRHAIDNLKFEAKSLVVGVSTSASAQPTAWQSSASFTGLAPGTYYVWAAKTETSSCNKQIGTFEIVNINPVVDLGADTTICAGETLVLDAGNTGATYVWSGTNVVTQTLEVDSEGTYTVYATAPNGCYGIGNINVYLNDAPTASGIFRQGMYPNFTFTVLNANNADTYNWNFGDGTTLTNAPATVNHFYTSDASVTVTATLSNDCGSTTVTQNYGDLSINAQELEGLEVYPNPAEEQFVVSLFGSNDATVTVLSTTGTIVLNQTSFSDKLTVNTGQWESGIYFVTVTHNGMTSTQKLIVK